MSGELDVPSAAPSGVGSAEPTSTPGGAPRWWQAALAYLAVGAVVWLVVGVAGAVLPREYLYPRATNVPGGALVEVWVRWDASWYREIVRHGYEYFPGVQSSVVYFPAYPLVIAAVHALGPGIYASAVMVTVASGLGASVLFATWCRDRVTPRVARTALLALLVFPFSWYLYGAVYSDAFFLCVALAAFVFVERQRYWAAGLAALLAGAARPTGVAVALGVVLVVLERASGPRSAPADPGAGWFRRVGPELTRRFDPRSFTLRQAPVLLGFGGLLAWMAYLWLRFGDPLLFVHAESAWGQGSGPRTWFKVLIFERMFEDGRAFPTGLLLHGLVGGAALCLVPRVARSLGWAYAAYVVLVVGIPMVGTKDFMSTGRYALAAFPCFATLALMLEERRHPAWRLGWLAVSATTMLVLASLWASGKYLA